jgi:putative phage-type endonuclease
MKRYRIIDDQRSVQGSKEWLEFRRGKISASISPSIMGVGFQTPLQAWESIVFSKSIADNAAMKRGRDLEPIARDLFNKTHKSNFQPAVVQSLKNENFIASLDGFYEDDHGRPYVLEIKCAGPVDHAIALGGSIPPKYIPQLTHQADIVGVDVVTYYSFDGKEGVTVMHKIDPDYSKTLMLKELDFLESLIEMKPPKPTDKDWVEETDPSLRELIDQYNHLSESIDLMEESKERIKKLITSEMMHARTVIGKNKVQKIVKSGNIDYTSLVESLRIDEHVLSKFRKPTTEYWKISY